MRKLLLAAILLALTPALAQQRLPALGLQELFHPTFTVPNDPSKVRTLLVTGDVIPSRGVNFYSTQRRDFLWPFRPTASFVRAWTEAIAVIHRDKPFTLKVIERYTRSDDPETVEETYRTMAPHFKRTPLPPVEVIQTYLRELGQQGERAKGLRVDDLVDARFVRQLEQSGFIAGLYR